LHWKAAALSYLSFFYEIILFFKYYEIIRFPEAPVEVPWIEDALRNILRADLVMVRYAFLWKLQCVHVC
jgi:hypothetical protein